MLKRFSSGPGSTGFRILLILAARTLAALPALAETPDPTAALDRAIAEAERNLSLEELQTAESRYRSALLEGWLLRGALAVADAELEAARQAFEHAATVAVETRRALTSLALVQLRLGEAAEAVQTLRRVVSRDPGSIDDRRLLAQALVAAGRAEEALQELEEALAMNPDDAETAFNLATGYLRAGKLEDAERLFARVRALRPIPQTEVLIGRMYRDSRDFERARRLLETALAMDPEVRRAHYYLGTVELLASGRDGLEDAIRRFRRELEIAPEEPMTHLYLGLALAESRRYEEALSLLAVAERWPPARLDALRYRGRSLLGLNRVDEAITALRQALTLAEGSGARDRQLSSIHYQLGLALRREGSADETAEHFAAAEEYSGKLVAGERERFADFLAETSDGTGGSATPELPIGVPAIAGLSPEDRRRLEGTVRSALARAYFNLGVLQVQARRVVRAVGLFERAAEAEPDFPRLQHSLGVAYFNAERFVEAADPLSRALAQDPGNRELRRLLALTCLNTEDYGRAADLLDDDPQRRTDPRLQYAYALALVRSGHAHRAEAVFEALLRENSAWPELHVLLGQAYAQQGDHDAAIAALRHALVLRDDVAEAHATLGDLYLRRGALEEAERELRAELLAHPEDLRSRYLLATVLDLNRKPEAARSELERVLRARPDFADARYLLGKILLGEGAAEAASAHLEAAAQLAPEDPNVFYQLGQAYQRLGRTDLAARQFEIYRDLKKKERSSES